MVRKIDKIVEEVLPLMDEKLVFLDLSSSSKSDVGSFDEIFKKEIDKNTGDNTTRYNLHKDPQAQLKIKRIINKLTPGNISLIGTGREKLVIGVNDSLVLKAEVLQGNRIPGGEYISDESKNSDKVLQSVFSVNIRGRKKLDHKGKFKIKDKHYDNHYKLKFFPRADNIMNSPFSKNFDRNEKLFALIFLMSNLAKDDNLLFGDHKLANIGFQKNGSLVVIDEEAVVAKRDIEDHSRYNRLSGSDGGYEQYENEKLLISLWVEFPAPWGVKCFCERVYT